MRDEQPSGGGLVVALILAGIIATKPATAATHRHKPRPVAVLAKVAAPIGSRQLSPAAILRYAHAEGFTGQRARVAVAVALAESAGRVLAHNPVPPDDSYCLMQINMLGRLGPARRARLGLARNSDLYDPAICMRAAYVISGGGADFTPWTTYTSGAYKRHLHRVP